LKKNEKLRCYLASGKCRRLSPLPRKCPVLANVRFWQMLLKKSSAIPLGQKIKAEKNGDTVLIRGSPVGQGDYDL
jgi:hypothetical protein